MEYSIPKGMWKLVGYMTWNYIDSLATGNNVKFVIFRKVIPNSCLTFLFTVYREISWVVKAR